MSEKLISSKDRGFSPKGILRVIPAPVLLAALMACRFPGGTSVDVSVSARLNPVSIVDVSGGIEITDAQGNDHRLGGSFVDGKAFPWSAHKR